MRYQTVDTLLSGLFDYLKDLPGTCDMKYQRKPALSEQQMEHWEHQNRVRLPMDLKGFLSITDGLVVTWNSQILYPIEQLGKIDICSLSDIIEFTTGPTEDTQLTHAPQGYSKAFIIENCGNYGKVCLCYSSHQSQIWFYCNDDENWYFLSNTFSAYFRLCLCTLGIKGWQMGYTLVGFPGWTMNWMCYYSPQVASMIRTYAAEMKNKKPMEPIPVREVNYNGVQFQLEKVLKATNTQSRPSTASTK
jgi:tubulin polyglutamylase complex subunit 2